MKYGLSEAHMSRQIYDLELRRTSKFPDIRDTMDDEEWEGPEGDQRRYDSLVFFVKTFIQKSLNVAMKYAFNQVKMNLRGADKLAQEELQLQGRSVDQIILDEELSRESTEEELKPAVMSKVAHERREKAKRLIRSSVYRSRVGGYKPPPIGAGDKRGRGDIDFVSAVKHSSE